MLMEDFPKKKLNITKGTLFNLLPLDIINGIDTWIIGLEWND